MSLRLAEKEGFEPPVPRGTSVFKTGALNRSAISPLQRCETFIKKQYLYINF